jgi:predicted peptidase
MCIFVTTVLILNTMTVKAQEDDLGLSPEERHFKAAEKIQETVKLFEARIYVSDLGDTIPYRLLIPLDYDKNKKYPLVLGLSGDRGRGTDNIRQITGCWAVQVLSKSDNRKKYPCFVLAPQCPQGSYWGASPSEKDRESRLKAGQQLQPSVESFVFAIISLLEKEFNIDTGRRYVTGQSMGGYGSFHYILTYQQMFAAAIPVCGGADPDLGNSIIDVPIWAFHGGKDDLVPAELSRDMVQAINEAGGNARYTEFPDAGHFCWPLAFDTPGLLDWLFDQHR